ncbi:MAG: helix-turn-helix domain-containing protein [Rhodospirillales bacterium]|nr:helix-turn-helix domain-containing protein [Rhodospirillales bacterium]
MTASQLDFNPIRFSTVDLPVHDRVTMWREAFGRTMTKLDFEPSSDDPFGYEAVLRALPGLAVGSMTMTVMRIARGREMVVTEGNDNLGLTLLMEGTAFASRLGRDLWVTNGDVTLMTNAEPGTVGFPSDGRFLSLQMPGAALVSLVTNIDDVVVRPIPRNTEALRLLTGYVALLEQSPAPQTTELRRLAATHVHDLAALVLGATRDAAEVAKGRGVRAARLKMIKADIMNHLDHPGFAVATVAARHGITPSYVRLLFEGEGATFSKFVLHQRLARAHRLLSDPRFAHYSISAIATEAGFDDISYFNRCFRRRYGVTPSDIREQTRRQGMA